MKINHKLMTTAMVITSLGAVILPWVDDPLIRKIVVLSMEPGWLVVFYNTVKNWKKEVVDKESEW